MFRYELKEDFADVSFHAAVKGKIIPDNVTLAVSTWSIILSVFVVGKLVFKHFPQQHKYHSLFNKNNIKVSYSCMDNMGAIISKHNKNILSNNDTSDNNDKLCNCRSQQNCPLDNKCLTTSLIYNAQITSTTANQTTTKNYIGLTEGTFKQRYTLNTSQHSPTGNFLIALNYQNTSGNSKIATPTLQLNGLSSQEPAPITIQAKDVIYA